MLTELLPSDTILISETGHSGIRSSTMIFLTHPEQRYIRAAGTLGWAFPASLGAKCAAPDRPVLCFSGDGGFYYHLSELETARRCGINTVTIVNNNSGFGQCWGELVEEYGEEPNKIDALCRFDKVDFAGVARDIGCLGIRVERPEDIAGAIQKALESNLPAVVEVITDIKSITPQPWTPPNDP